MLRIVLINFRNAYRTVLITTRITFVFLFSSHATRVELLHQFAIPLNLLCSSHTRELLRQLQVRSLDYQLRANLSLHDITNDNIRYRQKQRINDGLALGFER